MSRVREQLTYANVMATIAVFIALGGTSYAAIKVTGRNVKNSSLTYKDLKKNTLGGTRIKESRLGTVPRAKTLSGGYSAGRLLVRCAAGTTPIAGACVETTARPALPWSDAANACARHATPQTPGRRIATVIEVRGVIGIQGVALAPGGELTSDIVSPTSDGLVVAQTVTGAVGAGGVGTVPDTFDGRRGFRCAYTPING
jgi:hypothetical protein